MGRRGRTLGAAVAVVTAGAVLVGAAVLLQRTPPQDVAGRDVVAPRTLPTGDAVPRSASPLTRYAAVARSDSWLLYARTTRDDGVPVVGQALPYPRDERYLLDGAGHETAVPRAAAVSLLGDRPLLLRLADPPRFEDSAALENRTSRAIGLRWSLPASGRSGAATLPPRTTIVAFAPDASWVTATTVGSGRADTRSAPIDRLTRTSTDGRRVDLGVPFPLGAPYTLIVSPVGLVAYSAAGDGGDFAPNGQIRFRPWSGGTWRTLNPGDPPQGEIECSPASALLLCRVAGPAGVGYRSLLFDLRAGTRTVLRRSRAFPAGCATAQTAAGSAFIGVVGDDGIDGRRCPAGRLSRLAEDGGVVLSSRSYDRFHVPVVAFGHIVVDEAREHRLLALRSIDAAPTVLVGR